MRKLEGDRYGKYIYSFSGLYFFNSIPINDIWNRGGWWYIMKVLSQDGQILTDGTLEILPEYYTEKEVEEMGVDEEEIKGWVIAHPCEGRILRMGTYESYEEAKNEMTKIVNACAEGEKIFKM